MNSALERKIIASQKIASPSSFEKSPHRGSNPVRSHGINRIMPRRIRDIFNLKKVVKKRRGAHLQEISHYMTNSKIVTQTV